MSRAHLRLPCVDRAGNVYENARVFAYEYGTTSAITDLYLNRTGGSPVASLVSDGHGMAEGWVDEARLLTCRLTDNSDAAIYAGHPGTFATFPDDDVTVALKEKLAEMVPTRLYPSALGWALPQDIANTYDGLSRRWPKRDVWGAYDIGTATGVVIEYEDGTYVDDSNHAAGLWIQGAGDVGALPSGWREQIPLVLIGEEYRIIGGHTGGLCANLNGGSSTDQTVGILKASGLNTWLELRNVANLNCAAPAVLGEQADGSGSTNSALARFYNVALRCNQGAGYGPAWRIKSHYWGWWERCMTASNEQAAWDSDDAAGFLIEGDANGEGLLFITDHEFNGGGGIKNYSSASVKITVTNPTQEGKTTGDLTSGPIYDLLSGGVTEGHAIIINPTQADAPVRMPTVRVHPNNDASVVQVFGSDDIEGPASTFGTYKNRRSSWTKTPDGHHQEGTNHGKVYGQLNLPGGPVPVRVLNLASTDPAGWATSGVLTTGKEDRYGKSLGAELSGNNSFTTFYNASTLDPAAGDWILAYLEHKRIGSDHPNWVSRSVMQVGVTGAGNLLEIPGGATTTSMAKVPDYIADGWQRDFILVRVSAFPTVAGAINFNGYADTGEEMQYAYPVLSILPAAWGESEAWAFARSLVPYSNNVVVGDVGLLPGQALSFDGTRDLAGLGTPEGAVTAPIGSTYRRKNGGTGTTLYVKETGSGNTGWVAVSAGGGAGAGIVSVVRKTADETVNNSNTPQADDHLAWGVAASESWYFEGLLLVQSVSINSDFRVKMDSVPAGTTVQWGGVTGTTGVPGFAGNIGASSAPIALRPAGTELDFGSFNGVYGVHIEGIVTVAATPGTVTLKWSQGTATVEDTKLLTGSFLRVTKLTP